MTTETIDKLFLELSQVASVKTKKELNLEMRLVATSKALFALRAQINEAPSLEDKDRAWLQQVLWNIHDVLTKDDPGAEWRRPL